MAKSRTRSLGLSVLDKAKLYGTRSSRRPAKQNAVRLRKKAAGKYYASVTNVRLNLFTTTTFDPCKRGKHDACAHITLSDGVVPETCDCVCHVVPVKKQRKRQAPVLEISYNRGDQQNTKQSSTFVREMRTTVAPAPVQLHMNETPLAALWHGGKVYALALIAAAFDVDRTIHVGYHGLSCKCENWKLATDRIQAHMMNHIMWAKKN